MASPVTPKQASDLIPVVSTEPCTAIRNIFFTLPRLFSDFLSWLLNADGTLSNDLIAGIFKPGMIMGFGGASPPAGWVLCDGGEYSRADYPDLFAAIGVTWGSGDGVTTFNVPDSKRRVLVGSDASSAKFVFGVVGGEEDHVLNVTEIPPHTHDLTVDQQDSGGGGQNNTMYDGADNGSIVGGITVTTGSGTGGGVGHNNLPPYFAANYIIKT